MNLVFGEHTVTLDSWDHRRQMLSYLEDCPMGHVLLGDNQESGSDFYSITICYEGYGNRRFGIGVCSQGYGLTPSLLLLPDSQMMLLGYDLSVFGFSVAAQKIVFALDLDSVFYRFIRIQRQGTLLVQHEIGVLAIEEDGDILWKFSRDIITDLTLDHESVHLEFLDAPSTTLRLNNGAECR